jgi:hypothetical protein
MTQRMLPAAIALLLSVSSHAVAAGEPSRFQARQPSDAFGLVPLGGSSADRTLEFVAGPPTAEKDIVRRIMRSRGQGGGGDVTALEVIQIEYGGPEGNVLLLIWDEATENTEGVNVFQDGNLLGNVPGLPADQLPGTQAIRLTEAPLGVHMYRVEGEGTSSEKSQEVVAAQPFADPTAVACEKGDFRNPENGTCEIRASWSHAGTAATTFAILVDTVFLGEIDGSSRDVDINGAAPGNHCVGVIGFLYTPQGNYRGATVESCCEIVCEDMPCDPLGNLLICQIEYGAVPSENLLLVEWDNGEIPYVSVAGFIDNNPAGTLTGDSEAAVVGNLAAGMHTIGLEGDCAANGKTPRLEGMFNVLSETPHRNPVSGALVCTFDSAGPSTLVTWTLGDPSAFIDVFVTREPDTFYLGRLNGGATGVRVTNTVETDVISLQFFTFVDEMCYGSEIIACGDAAGVFYIQGVCDGVGSTPQLASAVFGLQHLFLSGEAPPCMKACDADGNGSVVLGDMVLILNFLFQGGVAPSLWVDSNGDTIADPVCTQAAPEDDCAVGNQACPL